MDKPRALQVRVDAETARRFEVLAAAMGLTQSQLLRKAVEDTLAEAEKQIDRIQEQVRAKRG